ncbi:hypothetical protein [Pontiella sp.]|uniref:hypothetical protein n=1 Tax=Pontiella sp. TaxID=2837462 RepID=UPI00356B35DB
MTLDLIRKPQGNLRVSSVLIAVLLFLGLVPTLIIGASGLLIAWVFSIFHPLIFIAMTAVVFLCACSAAVQFLILCDIAVGRPGLSAVRLLGSAVFICVGWSAAYFVIEGNAGSHFYAPFTARELITIQCSAVFPVLVPVTSAVLRQKRAAASVVYFLCFPVFWWWGASSISRAVESVTHSNAERMERMAAEEQSAREHNRACREKIIAIRALDPAADAQRFYTEHGEIYLPWTFGSEFMSFPGLPEKKGSDTSHAFRMRLVRMNPEVLQRLPVCLCFPPPADWRQLRYTESFKAIFEAERRAYMTAFNQEMVRLVERAGD